MIVDHLAEIFIARSPGIFFKTFLAAPLIDIAQGDDAHIFFLGDGVDVSRALPAHADSSDANDLAGRHLPQAQHMAGNDHDTGPCRRRSTDHLPPRNLPAHRNTSVRTIPPEWLSAGC